MTRKNIFVHKHFLSLNISDFNLFFTQKLQPPPSSKRSCPSFQPTPLVSAWVLVPPSQTITQQFLLSPQALKIVTSPPRQKKETRPDIPNALNMFNSNTYTNFKIPYKHMMLILQWCYAQELFESQTPVTTGGFELIVFIGVSPPQKHHPSFSCQAPIKST